MSTKGKLRKAPKIHDIWADAQVCDISASVVLRGEQQVRTWRGEDSRGRHVACQIGRVLVYLFDHEAVTSHLNTWTRAERLGARAFPPEYSAQPPRNADDPDRPLSVGSVVLQCEREQRPVRADAATTAAAGLPYVQVQVGRLVVVCLDAAALASCRDTWQKADEAAEGWLIDADDAREQRRAVAAFERNWSKAEDAVAEAPVLREPVDLGGVARRSVGIEPQLTTLETQLRRASDE
jgi:hypothetical protein